MAESPASPSPQLLAQHDASKGHHVDPKDAPTLNVSPYVANILDSSVCNSLWTAIEEDVAVTSAHRQLASRRQSNGKQPYATFFLNDLSLSASTSASHDATDDDHAIIFDSAAHHIARGDFRGDACGTPDWVAVQVPWREVRQTVRDTMAMVELAVKAQGGKSVQEGVPCIEQISIGDVTKEPCTDLAHNARYKPGTGARVRTGTPMFMACELSSSTRGFKLAYGDTSLKRLGRKLRAVEELGDGFVFKRAFPGDDSDETFMEKFQLVLEAEEERIDSGVKVTTHAQTAHLPRHDIESFFWVLLWSLARVCPEGAAFEDSDGPFSKWADVMLHHTIGDESSRWFQLNAAQGLGAMLHEDLEHLSIIIEDIAAYLVVPWARYEHIVDEEHVYVAIRRLLLAAIHALANDPSKDVRLSTMQPHVIKL